MADIRCPMCGKLNPGDAVICQFCQARLQPVSSPNSSDEEGGDWMGKLRGAEENTGSSSSGGNDDAPDWLARIRSDSSDHLEDHDKNNTTQSRQSEIPDWLKALKNVEGEKSAEEEASVEAEGNEVSAPEGEAEDWLNGLRASAQQEEPVSSEPQEISQPVEPPSSGPVSPAETQEPEEDWLRGLESWQSAPQEEQPAVPQEPATAQPAEDPDAWLRSLQNWQPVSSAEETESGTIPPETAASLEMLLGEGPELSTETPLEAQPEQPSSEIPAASPFSVSVEGGAESALPDWLNSFQEDQLFSSDVKKRRLPDWLNAVESGAAVSASAAETLPDWLATSEGETPAFEVAARPETTEEAVQTPFSAPVEIPEIQPSMIMPFAGGDLPDWLTQAQAPVEGSTVTTGEPGQEEGHPFVGENLPGWLTNEEVEIPTVSASAVEAVEPEEIASAQLPDWLQAMRPVESVAPQTAGLINEKSIEEAGPLAGMQAVLPAENLSTQYRKPPIYSVKLQMTERQRAYAGLLERTLGEESRFKPAPAKTVGVSQRLIRVLIGLLLMVVMISLVVLTPAAAPAPDLVGSPAVEKFNRAIESIPEGSVVLIAADFEPGFQGEMRLASRGMIQRLITQKVRLALISSLPSGPVVAANLVSEAHSLLYPSISSGYLLKDQVINLGYLPGGIVSLQEFALQPQQAVRYGLNSARDGRVVWQNPALNSITQLTDFAAVIVLTDSLDNGRAWIEQVQPTLGGKRPFLVVASAQSAPWISPYVESGQVSGMLAGVPDAMVFQKDMNVPGIQPGIMYSLQAGSLIGVVLILLGLFLPSVFGMFKRNPEN